ncbi:hypothetical protein [Myxococcus sp. RHSTA-1-4]|uniref:hypothetical protein n=1 Tax=Myxococcus sp. RHSTA-1-4 TaxID=2874601 RepID=UPI001CBC6CA6|nr:hypothetical protein [Myxococcus sp. RHSTA-1-4]MBZ4415226.1 hypothetical protein [Myxococcus sp. RHSTA-1-4]
MLTLVAAVLLAATPTSPSPSLLSPESGRHLSARLLVAQAPPEAPASRVDPELDARIHELTRQVALLQSEIRGIDVNFPVGSLLMAYFGYVLSPLLLVGIPLIIVGLGEEDDGDQATMIGVGAGLSLAGVAGVGLLVAGFINGTQASNDNRARREELIRERIRLEDELRDLKARRDARTTLQARRWQPRPTIPLLALRF